MNLDGEDFDGEESPVQLIVELAHQGPTSQRLHMHSDSSLAVTIPKAVLRTLAEL